jgi:glycosyltransferase 2 family protein
LLTSVRFWVGAAITAVFLVLLLLRFDFGEMRDSLADANYAYLVPAIGVYYVSLYFRSFRWSYVLRPFAATRTNRLFPVVMVGYMANNVLPMRIGEFARSYYLSTRESIRGSTALATILIERVFDGLTLLFFLAVGMLFLPVTGLTERVSESVELPFGVEPTGALVTAVVIAPFVGVLTMMVLAALYPETFIRWAERFARIAPEKYRAPALGLVVRFLGGFEGLHRPSRVASVFLLSVPIWLAEGTMYYIVALGFDLQTHADSIGTMIVVMLVVTSISNLATSIPSSQGSVGPFEFFAALSIVTLLPGMSTGLALAYAVILHLALLLPVIATGFLHLALRSVSLSDLTRRRLTDTPEDLT